MRLCDLLLTVSPPPFKKSWWHPIILVMPHSKMSKTWFYLIAVFALKHAPLKSLNPQGNPGSNPFRNWCPKSHHSGSKSSKLSHHFLALKLKYCMAFTSLVLNNLKKKIFKVRPFWLTMFSVMFLSCFVFHVWKYVIKIGISMLGLKLWRDRVIFFFPNPFWFALSPYAAVAKFVSSGYEKIIEKSRLPI